MSNITIEGEYDEKDDDLADEEKDDAHEDEIQQEEGCVMITKEGEEDCDGEVLGEEGNARRMSTRESTKDKKKPHANILERELEPDASKSQAPRKVSLMSFCCSPLFMPQYLNAHMWIQA